jgi:hypothetical protein
MAQDPSTAMPPATAADSMVYRSGKPLGLVAGIGDPVGQASLW